MSQKSRIALGISALALSAALVMPVSAQVALEEIVVTARKREESLQEIPIAISAFSAAQLERAGFKDLHELSLNVAGLQYHSLGLAIPGRVNSSIRFRGMDVNTQSPTFQLATLFVDGIYVLGNTESIPFDDVERVEVVKGPQAAYFGRNTFGGAVNYIMKTPSTTDYSGEVKASGATYDEYDVSASFDGPIVQDKLGVRFGGRLYSKGSMFTASDGGGLGEESSKSLQGTIFATPTDQFSARVRVFYAKDDDGPPAGGNIPGRLNDTCTGKTITTKVGDTARPVRYICGIVPKQGKAINALGLPRIIDSNTTSTSGRALLSTGNANYILTNLIKKPQAAALAGVPELDRIGMERNIFRLSGNSEYEFRNGITATAQGGYNKQQVNWVRDYTFTPFDNAYSRDPQDLEDYSLEARLASAQDQKLRWMVGVNYYEQDLITSGTGGDSIFLCVDTIPGVLFGTCQVPANPLTAPAVLAFTNSAANTDHVETRGVYAALSYDITDQLTFNLEGRRQKDLLVRGLAVRTSATFKSWLPRAILQFKPNDDTNIYASYAKGVIPGELNSAVLDNTSASTQAQFTALGILKLLPEETLDSYEVGWKQQFLDNRLSVNLAGYYGEWVNKKSRIQAAIQFTCGEGPNGVLTNPGCRGAALGEAGAGQLARTALGAFFSPTNVVVSGTSKIWGFELESNAALAEGWTAGWTLDYAGNKLTQFTANFILPYANFSNVKGNAHARFPKWSGSVNSAYQAQFTTDWEWFVRGDLSYFGKTFIDVDNLAQCDSYMLANARTGIESESARIEFFVKNLFDDNNWAACARFSEFDLPTDVTFLTSYQTVVVSPQNKRQFGIRTSIKF
ncbi:MAG: TonB-dependent receptor [Rhodospirillaceae bacterium]|nr:TonB-dependent receptor [Rhodospirillaceae bacterium]